MSDQETLPPELAELQALAIAADGQLDGVNLVPGAAPPIKVDEAAALADLLTLAIKVGGKVLDPLPKFFPPDTCTEIAEAYLACADKHGWTWHKHTGGPEIRLGLAIGVPAVLCAIECKQWLAWKREQAAAAAATAKTGNLADPLAPVNGGR